MYFFLKSQKQFILFYAITVLIYIILNELYWNKNWNQILYSTFLVTVTFVVFMVRNAIYYVQKKRKLLELEENILLNHPRFEENTEEIEKIYERIIEKEEKEIIRLKTIYAQEKNEMESYYTTWAHQIKTPIAAIKLVLQEETPLEKQIVVEQLFEIEEYVSMNLNYMQLSKNQIDYVFKNNNLDRMIREVIRKYAMFFIRKKIKMNYETIDKTVITDEKWFVFVLGQVLSNALKYTKEGTISIFSTKKEDEEYLVVSDTGIGINEEDLPRIFDWGYTGFNGRMDKKATGLGLFLCKKILNCMGFNIEIDSKINQGTNVFISLAQYKIKEDI